MFNKMPQVAMKKFVVQLVKKEIGDSIYGKTVTALQRNIY